MFRDVVETFHITILSFTVNTVNNIVRTISETSVRHVVAIEPT